MKLFFTIVLLSFTFLGSAQDPNDIIKSLKEKFEKVNDYEAVGRMKTNVIFIKAPIAKVKIYYKKPNKMKIKNESGVSFIPKGSVNVNMGSIFEIKNFNAMDAGVDKVNGVDVRVIKVLPEDEDESDIVIASLYVDVKNMLILKSKTTSKDNGTYELIMKYGDQASLGLPNNVQFSFNTKDYKLPKGVTFDYDNGAAKENEKKVKKTKGKIEISYSSYVINKGIKEEVFK
jgi:hypothetical protein